MTIAFKINLKQTICTIYITVYSVFSALITCKLILLNLNENEIFIKHLLQFIYKVL